MGHRFVSAGWPYLYDIPGLHNCVPMLFADIVARQDRLGILTHHLAHDAAAWAGLEALLENLAGHPAVRFADAGSILA